jgi:hypothetical protein
MSSKIDFDLFWADSSPRQQLVGRERDEIVPRFGTIGIAAVAAALAASRPAAASLERAVLPLAPMTRTGRRP